MKAQDRIRRLPPNNRGADYVVGDLHGHFSALESALTRIGFDGRRDRLLSVGDLVDRGPESHRTLDFLAEPWFFAIRGNHEQMMLDAVGGESVDPAAGGLWYQNGGSWFENIDEELAQSLLAAVSTLPYALAVELPDGRQMGLLHADAPAASWPATAAAIIEAEAGGKALEHVLWSRVRANIVRTRMDGRRRRGKVSVAGINRLFFGHTPMPQAIACGNTRWIDTGVFLSHGRLSISRLWDDALWSFVHHGDSVEHDWIALG